MASSASPKRGESPYTNMEGDPDADQKGIGFELKIHNLRDKKVLCLMYGDATMRIEEPLASDPTLKIEDNCLTTDDDVYELFYRNGKIYIQSIMETTNVIAKKNVEKEKEEFLDNSSNVEGRIPRQDEGKKHAESDIRDEGHSSSAKKCLDSNDMDQKGTFSTIGSGANQKSNFSRSVQLPRSLKDGHLSESAARSYRANAGGQAGVIGQITAEFDGANGQERVMIGNENGRFASKDTHSSSESISNDGHILQSDIKINPVPKSGDHPTVLPGHSHYNYSDSSTARKQSDEMRPGESDPAKRLYQGHDESPTRGKQGDVTTSRSTPSDLSIRVPDQSPDKNLTSGKKKGAVEVLSKVREPDLTRRLDHGFDNDSPADETLGHDQGYSPPEKVESKNQDEDEEPNTGSCTISNTDSEGLLTSRPPIAPPRYRKRSSMPKNDSGNNAKHGVGNNTNPASSKVGTDCRGPSEQNKDPKYNTKSTSDKIVEPGSAADDPEPDAKLKLEKGDDSNKVKTASLSTQRSGSTNPDSVKDMQVSDNNHQFEKEDDGSREPGQEASGGDTQAGADDTGDAENNYELNVTVKYAYKREFAVDAGVACDFETYMKWNYVLNNPTMFQTKQVNLMTKGVPLKETEKLEEGRGIVIDYGEVKSSIRNTDNLRDKVVKEILLDTGPLHFNSFLTGGVERVEVSRQMMKKSANQLQHQLWCLADEKEELIHYVCPQTMSREVEGIIKTVVDELVVVEKQLEYGLVFYEVFKRHNVKHKVGEQSSVEMDIDCLESKSKCIVTLTGSRPKVELVEKWLKKQYIDNFQVNEISFKDIKGLEDTDIVLIVDEYLKEQAYGNVFWYVDGKKGKICVCANAADSCDKITGLVKRLKRKTLPDKYRQIICDSKEVKEHRVIVRQVKDASEVEVIGLKADLDRIKSIINESATTQDRPHSSTQRDNEGDTLTNKPNNSGSVDIKHSKMPDKEKEPKEQTNVPPEKNLVQTVPYPVRDPLTFRILFNSAELKNFASEQGVELQITEGSSKGFLIKGGQSQCMSVRDRLTKMISEYKSSWDRNPPTVQWTLSCGHQIIIQSSMYLQDDVDHVVLVQEVPANEAKFDERFKLGLPFWNEDKKKDVRERIQKHLEELLSYCWSQRLFTVKLEIPVLNKKVSQWFTVSLFEQLSRGDEGGNPPITLYICTNDTGVYNQLEEQCDANMKKELKYQHDNSTKKEENLDQSSEGETTPDVRRIKVTRIIGQINGTPADAIVNTIGRDLNLSNGFVSNALLRSAGDELQNEVWRKCPSRKIQFGEIVVTPAYGLHGCKHVLHGAVEAYDTSRKTKGLHKFVLDCLEKADRLQCHTISFPAIGTGNLGYPRHLVAHTMYNAVREYEGRQRHLNEVKFVIYHGDEKTIKAFTNEEKEHAKYYDESGRLKEIVHIGAVAVSVEYGTVMDVFGDCLMYIWERQYSYTVPVKNHELLKNAGDMVRKQWTSHRHDTSKRGQILQTPGGNLAVTTIIHVFSEDSSSGLQKAICKGLQAADNCGSVTVFFDKSSQFLRYGKECVHAFADSVKETLNKGSRIKRICMVVDKMVMAKSFIREFTQSTKALDEGGTKMPSPQAPVSLQAPVSPEIDRGSAEGGSSDKSVESLQDQKAEWQDNKSTYLKQPQSCQCYILQKKHKSNKRNTKPQPLNVKVDNGETKTLMKCESREKAEYLIQSKQQEYEKLPIQSLHDFRFEPRKCSGNETELQEMDVDCRAKGKSWIAPTIYQLKCAFGITKHDTDRERKESQGFDHVTQCSSEIWSIVKERKRESLQSLKEQGRQVSFETECIHISNISSSHKPPEVQVIEAYIKFLQEMSIMEVQLDQTDRKSDRDIQAWCTSIEQQHGKECCIFYKEKYSVLVYCDTYENAQKVKHQIMVKDGQVKVKPRRGQRVLKDPLDSGLGLPESSTATEESDTVLLQNASADHRDDRDRGRKGQKKSINPEFTLERQSKNLERYTTDEGIQVLVYQANILKLPVDCIVNAANDSLQHGGGVARVIAQAAGRALDNEGFAHIRKHGKVPVGKACVTTAGKLHYDCVIHTVGPCWSDYRPHSRDEVQQCEKDLYSAIMESFLAAENRGLESIALPAISAAIFAVPTDLCVYHYAKATLDYSRTTSPTCLKEIHFIDINPAIISSIQKVFTTFLRDKRDPGYSTERHVKTRTSSFSDRYDAPRLSEMANNSRDIFAADNETVTINRDKCKLVISCEDIMQVKADAIVSSEDLQGSGKGYIARQIYNKLESSYKKSLGSEKKRFFDVNTQPGDVYVSFVLKPYSYVLHAVIPYELRTSPKEEKKHTIHTAYENVFQKIDEKPIGSAVTGLFGAGSGSYDDVQTATDAFIQAFEKYSEKPKFKPLHLTLVCKNQDVLNQVKRLCKDRGLIQIPDVPPRTPPTVPPRPSSERGPLDQQGQQNSDDPPASLEMCAICMDEITDKKVLNCGHAFDKGCIDQAFTFKKVCPTCGVVCGEITGNQPYGTINVQTQPYDHCAGYDDCGRIAITYNFPSGNQGADHPSPGKWYKGITRIAYLPNNDEGREVLEMLRIAFNRKLTFTIGTSRTTGQDGVITWNDIHHKTDHRPDSQFGYPDPTYLTRVKDELAAKGITPDQIPEQ